jgi:hypothetical protein
MNGEQLKRNLSLKQVENIKSIEKYIDEKIGGDFDFFSCFLARLISSSQGLRAAIILFLD